MPNVNNHATKQNPRQTQNTSGFWFYILQTNHGANIISVANHDMQTQLNDKPQMLSPKNKTKLVYKPKPGGHMERKEYERNPNALHLPHSSFSSPLNLLSILG